MKEVLYREVSVPISEILYVENLMNFYGIKEATIIYNNSSTAIINFTDNSEYLIFVLTDIINKAKNESNLCNFTKPDFNFIVRLEKKLKTYSESNEYLFQKRKNR